MKSIVYASVLITVLLAGSATVTTPAFADHDKVTVQIVEGSSTQGCEETEKGCYDPKEVTIDVGGEVTWENPDSASHTVTSGNLDEDAEDVGSDFDSSLFGPGNTFTHKFEEAGTFDYFCQVHPWMTGSVIVQEAAGEEEPGTTEVMGMSKDGSISVEMKTSDPKEGEQMEVKLHFVKSDGSSANHMNYDITATQDGNEVLSATGQHPPNHDGKGMHKTQELGSDNPVDFEVTLLGEGLPDEPPSEWTGPKDEVVKFHVVPEFGPIAAIVLAGSIAAIVTLTMTKGRFLLPSMTR